MDLIGATAAWLSNSAHWQGSNGIPARLLEHLALSGVSLLLAADSRGGVALDEEGQPRGLVTVDAIASALRDDRRDGAGASAAGDAKVTAEGGDS